MRNEDSRQIICMVAGSLALGIALTYPISNLIEKRRSAEEARQEFEAFIKSIEEQQPELERQTMALRFRLARLRAESGMTWEEIIAEDPALLDPIDFPPLESIPDRTVDDRVIKKRR